jgi:hypothetical protein
MDSIVLVDVEPRLFDDYSPEMQGGTKFITMTPTDDRVRGALVVCSVFVIKQIWEKMPQGILVVGRVQDFDKIPSTMVIDYCSLYSWQEVLFRLNRMRQGASYSPSWGLVSFVHGGVVIDGHFRSLGHSESRLLRFLLQYSGEYFADSVIAQFFSLGPKSRVASVYISRIRKLLDSIDNLSGQELLTTQRGRGYMLVP